MATIPRGARIAALIFIFGCFGVSVWAGVIAAQTDPSAGVGTASAPTASNQFAILVTTVAGFASLLATQFFAMYRENRNRKWDLQDRTQARAEMRAHAEVQREETLRTAIELAKVSNINRDHLLGAIEKNTSLTAKSAEQAEAAYSVANNFNEKLETLHSELQSMAKKSLETSS